MNKFLPVLVVILCILTLTGIAAAQSYTAGSGKSGIDILGAHNNYGRGCAGCHEPHGGAKASGGSTLTLTNNLTFNDPNSGTNALFAQDVSPLANQPLKFVNDGGGGTGFLYTTPSLTAAYTTNKEELRGIMMCLACHDGVLAKGNMMQGVSWEQAQGLLPGTYGNALQIPTFLNQGGTVGYQADHPVGTAATLGAVGLVTNNATTSPLTVTVAANGAISSIVPTQGTAYAQFATNYGYPSIAGYTAVGSDQKWGVAVPAGGASNGFDAFITCRTCHNQHVMYIYKAPSNKQAGTAIVTTVNAGGVATATYPTYFFVNGPYNPGGGTGAVGAGLASSATQFCRQCHIDMANESYGVNNVQTQF